MLPGPLLHVGLCASARQPGRAPAILDPRHEYCLNSLTGINFLPPGASISLQFRAKAAMLHCNNPLYQEFPMTIRPNPGASRRGDTPLYPWGMSTRIAANEPWSSAFAPGVHGQAAIAAFSRCANHALSEQIQNAYRGAEQARDCAHMAAFFARQLSPGVARDALVAAWTRHEAAAGRMMNEVLRFGREHGHQAFAFPPYS